MKALIAAIAALAMLAPAFAHDSWISRGSHRNAAGEWCCGEGDCFIVTVHSAYRRDKNGAGVFGFLIEGADPNPDTWEFVPESERQPSPDGAYWRCKRPDGSRQCFFGPEPQT